MTRIPLAALVLHSSEDIQHARDRAYALAAAAKLCPFGRNEAESHLFRRFPGMAAADRAVVAGWMASL